MRPAAVLLAVLACAVALAACGNDTTTVTVDTTVTASTATDMTTTEPPPTTETTTTATTQTTSPDAPGPPTATVARPFFRAPSSNIGCVIADGTARCDIRARSWGVPPRPSSCNLDYGQGLTVGRSGSGTFVCAGDTALDPRNPVLPYGEDSRVGAVTCASREAGVTCTNADTGHGFFIARERYRLF